jgi:hypothetical protein
MTSAVKFGLSQAALLGGAGLVLGVIAGWVGLLTASGADAVAAVIANVYLVLVVLLPALLWFWTWASLDDEDQDHYRAQGTAIGLLLLAAVAGCASATLVFMVVAANIAAIFGHVDNLQVRVALLADIGWQRALLLLVVTSAVAVALALWAHRKVSSAR